MGYLTTFNGEVNLEGINPQYLAKIENIVSSKLSDIMSVDKDTMTLYIKGEYDNSEDTVQKFLTKISPALVVESSIIIEAQGQSPEDRWDIIITDEGLFIQEYILVKNGPPKKVGH